MGLSHLISKLEGDLSLPNASEADNGNPLTITIDEKFLFKRVKLLMAADKFCVSRQWEV